MRADDSVAVYGSNGLIISGKNTWNDLTLCVQEIVIGKNKNSIFCLTFFTQHQEQSLVQKLKTKQKVSEYKFLLKAHLNCFI